MVQQRLHAGFADSLKTGTNSAAGLGDLFVGCAGNALFKIHQPGRSEYRMGVRIHESRQHDLSRAIDLDNLPAVFFDPRIAQCVFGFAGGNNPSAHAQDRAVFDDAEFLQFRTAARTGISGGATQGQQFADVDQQERMALVVDWMSHSTVSLAVTVWGRAYLAGFVWCLCTKACRALLGPDGPSRLRSAQAPARPYMVLAELLFHRYLDVIGFGKLFRFFVSGVNVA